MGSARPEALAAGPLDDLAQWLLRHPEALLLISGHTDATGSRQTNLALSQARAASVERALVDRGVPSQRMALRAAADSEPLDGSVSARADNRRVSFTLLGGPSCADASVSRRGP
jgi:OmpA-OmpF porin, OOP family